MKYPKEKKRKTNNDVQNTKQKRQTMIYKILNRKLQTEQHELHKKKAEMKPGSDVIKSCSTNSNRRTIVTNSVINHEWGNDGIMITPIGIYPLLFVTQIFHKNRFIDWLVIAYRPERSISAIFRTRTSSMIYGN